MRRPPVGYCRGDEHEYEHRSNCFQCLHEQVSQHHRSGTGLGRDLSQRDSRRDADGNLQHEAAAHDAVDYCWCCHAPPDSAAA
jgi:hypothetical protein